MKLILLFSLLNLSSCRSAEKIPVIENLPSGMNCYTIGTVQGQSIDKGYDDALYEAKVEASRINGTHILIMRKYQDKIKDDSIKAFRKVYIVSARVYECKPL